MFLDRHPLTDNIELDTWLEKLSTYVELILKGKCSEVATLTVNDATPDVGDGNFFKTANTEATTITGLDGGSNGQSVYIVIGDVNTTIDFTSTNLKGNGGVDWVPTTNDLMLCIKDSATWFCGINSSNSDTIIGSNNNDHGLLDGLLDDDHTQYLTTARGDARYLLVTGTKTTVIVADASVVVGDALYCGNDFQYERCDANSAATMPCRCLALENGAGSNKEVLLEGEISNSVWDFIVGNVLVSGTLGELTQTILAVSGDQVQRVGWALSSDTIYFRPDSTIVEIL